MGGYAGVVIKIPILVLPVLLCWWWMMMMMMVIQWGLTIVLHLTAGGWWRTYKGFSPHLWMNKWWGLTVVWCLIHFLEGGWGHHQLCLLHGPWCGTSFISLWWLCQCHQGTLYLTVAWTAAWPRPQMWCKLPWPCHHWRICTWGTAKWLQLEAGWVQTVVPMQEMPLRETEPSPAGSISLLQLSLGEDLAPDSGNALGHWSESSVWQLLSSPCQRSQGHKSWPGMTCWPQMMTCDCVPPTGDWSTSQSIPRPLSFAPFWAAAWWRSTPKVFLLLAPSHQCLQWCDAGKGRCSWGHGSTS